MTRYQRDRDRFIFGCLFLFTCGACYVAGKVIGIIFDVSGGW